MAPNSKFLLRTDDSHHLGVKFEMVVRQNTPEMLRQRRLLPLCLAPGRDSLRPYFEVPSHRRTSFALPTASLKTRCRRWSLSTFLQQRRQVLDLAANRHPLVHQRLRPHRSRPSSPQMDKGG